MAAHVRPGQLPGGDLAWALTSRQAQGRESWHPGRRLAANGDSPTIVS